MTRERLPNRRVSFSFDLEVAGLRYTATVSRFADGRIGELFLNNHKSNSAAGTNVRDSAIVFSFAVQHGADPDAIRRALCRDSNGNASGPLGRALDIIAKRRRAMTNDATQIMLLRAVKRAARQAHPDVAQLTWPEMLAFIWDRLHRYR